MSTLKQRILSRSVTLGVVGLGYVGLPLAVEKAKAGFQWSGLISSKKRWIWSTAGTTISATSLLTT